MSHLTFAFLIAFSAIAMTSVVPASYAEENAASQAQPAPAAGAEVKKDEAKPAKTNEPIKSALLDNIPQAGDFVKGDAKAPVTIIEYASLTCPHCAYFHQQVIPTVEKDYISKGKVKYILRPYPLNAPALKAADLVDCIGEEGGAERYYSFVKVLFESQDKWAYDENYLTPLETFATVGGVSKEKFQACLADDAREKKILQWRKIATDELKVSHTPYIFINGRVYDKKPDPTIFSKALDEALAAKK